MKTETPDPKPEVPTPRARLKVCRCRYMAEKNWGYDLQKYVGGRKYWKPIGCAPNIETAESAIASFKTVLVRCNGCGSELLRESPPKPPTRPLGNEFHFPRAAIKSATGEAA